MAVARRRLHPAGPDLSALVWGAWRALNDARTDTPAGLAAMIDACLASGITSFDHAAVYGGYRTEALFGAALKEWKGARTSIEIVTKCGISAVSPQRPETRVKHYDASAAAIRASVDRSLLNFGTDYLDLLLIHRPDPFMDADDTARGLDDVLAAGKVRAIGVSNFAPAQLSLLQSRLARPLVTNQVQFSLSHVAPLFDGTFDQAQETRAAPMVWSPLGGGRLLATDDEATGHLAGVLDAMAARYGVEPMTLALAWVLAHPVGALPVIGTASAARVQTLARATSLMLDRQDWFALLEAARGMPVP